jgi:hypothetical protein
MIYALLAPTAIFLVWLGFEYLRGILRIRPLRAAPSPLTEGSTKSHVKGIGRNESFQFAERPPAPAPMRRHRPF